MPAVFYTAELNPIQGGGSFRDDADDDCCCDVTQQGACVVIMKSTNNVLLAITLLSFIQLKTTPFGAEIVFEIMVMMILATQHTKVHVRSQCLRSQAQPLLLFFAFFCRCGGEEEEQYVQGRDVQ